MSLPCSDLGALFFFSSFFFFFLCVSLDPHSCNSSITSLMFCYHYHDERNIISFTKMLSKQKHYTPRLTQSSWWFPFWVVMQRFIRSRPFCTGRVVLAVKYVGTWWLEELLPGVTMATSFVVCCTSLSRERGDDMLWDGGRKKGGSLGQWFQLPEWMENLEPCSAFG